MINRIAEALALAIPLFLRQRRIQVQYERIILPAKFGDHEFNAFCHQAADEMDVAAEAIELCHDDRRFDFLCCLQGRGELRPAVERISPLSGLDLLERLNQVEALSLGEPGERRLLRRIRVEAA